MWPLTVVLASVLALQTFSSRTLGVRVDVLVTDGRKPIAGLTARDFELRDNAVLQRVDVVEAADVPISVVLALDTSASIRGRRLTELMAAGDAVLDGLRPVDRAAVVTFNHAVTRTLPLSADLRGVRAELRAIDPGGRTSVMDGVYVALASTVDQPGRFLLIVCTDGSDTMSWLTPLEVLEASRRANAVVYAVTAGGGRRSEALKDLADATGGQVLQVNSGADLRSAFERILAEFRARYVLAYSPEGVSTGGFHRLDIKVPGRRVIVKARTGYIGVESARYP
jgi:VWFA-related protein